MKLDRFQKAKVVLGLSFFVLLFAILFVPNLVDNDIGWVSEDVLETSLLVLSFFSVVYVFWHYDYVVQKKEQENYHLTSKLQDKEKELLETFQYLGKVNVRFSVIQDLIDRMEKPVPTTQDDLSETLKGLLNIACSATSQDMAWLKIIDTKSRKTLFEELGGHASMEPRQANRISTKKLLSIYKNRKISKLNGFRVFYSELDNFYLKAFLILPYKDDFNGQSGSFLRAVANQCEILFLLFDSQYYRPKNKRHGKK